MVTMLSIQFAHARLFAELAGTKTLTKQAVNVIKNLGYTVTVEAPTYEL